MEKREPSYTVGGNAIWYSHHGKQCGDSFKKLVINPPYVPVIPLPDIYPEETKIEKDTRTQMFIAAVFTIARTWKHLDANRMMNG